MAQKACQPIKIVEDARVHVTAVGVQLRGLFRHGGDNPGMGVPHVRHVVIGIEIAPPVGIPEPAAFPAQDMQGRIVEG